MCPYEKTKINLNNIVFKKLYEIVLKLQEKITFNFAGYRCSLKERLNTEISITHI